jgi:hypothetical protein
MATQYFCKSKQRRQLLLAQAAPGLNGIDFLEVDPGQLVLHIHFLFNLPGTPNPVPPAPAPGLTANNIIIEGGERITGINVVPNSLVVALNVLTLTVSAAGDFSTYTLRLAAGPTDQDPPSGFDPVFSSVAFSFKANCPSDFDCAPITTCPPQPVTPLNINYLAKDYGSFRQLMFDRMAVTTPGWQERNPADLGVALIELLAYAGDQLSYYQDAVATEAYLGTARRRISVRRHARLLDYSMHDGCNARCFAFLDIAGGAQGHAAFDRGRRDAANPAARGRSAEPDAGPGEPGRPRLPHPRRSHGARRAQPDQLLHLERQSVLPAARGDRSHA